MRHERPSSQVLSVTQSRSFMVNHPPPPLRLDAGSLARCLPALNQGRHAASVGSRARWPAKLLSRQPCRLRDHPLANRSLRTSRSHGFSFAQLRRPRYVRAPHRGWLCGGSRDGPGGSCGKPGSGERASFVLRGKAGASGRCLPRKALPASLKRGEDL